MSLTQEQMATLLTHRIGVSEGLGTGVAAFAFNFSLNPIMVLSADSAIPTEEEIALLVLYQELKCSEYRKGYLEKFDAPIPVAEGHKTRAFIKGPTRRWPDMNGWAYRVATWQSGPLFSPLTGLPLDELIGSHMDGYRAMPWERWKTLKAEAST